MAARENTTIKGLTALWEEQRYSTKRAPYSPQPSTVEKAKLHRAMAVKMVTQLP